MINRIVVTKVHRAVFSPYKPVSVLIAFFDKNGEMQASQLLPANLFDEDIKEGQEIDFKKESPAPFLSTMSL